ncbi:MAG TPA: SDR family NAD(P)-dependent oxidoreductase [Chloroflexota bacterium]|nr:SDR family NAD(P)-dependent oxidoreductase [Chloroflexota bacterium]
MQRVALVTGAGSGIGRATAQLLHERGYSVVAADINADPVQQLVAGLENAIAVRCDVRVADDVRDAVAAAEERFGGLDAVAHIAGVEVDYPVDILREDQWDVVVDTNLKGTYLVCAAAVPALRRRGGGAIVTTGSVLGRVSMPGVTAYAASKAGVEALTRAMALDYAPDKIRANCVLPGSTDTPLMWAAIPPEQIPAVRVEVEKQIPLGRIAAPVEIARVIAFLLSDDAGFMTGTSIRADGGELTRSPLRM